MSKLIGNLETVSSDEPDWSRESKACFKWEPSRSLIASIRDYQRFSVSSNLFNQIILKKVAILRHRFWGIVTGADIPLNCQIEGGFLIPHPNGIVIHPGVKIGPNCLIFQQVTIGTKGQSGPPQIGGHVDIGAGAKILGNVIIGDHACIGANAVVIHDVPAGKTAAGVPAKILD
jgi:serine O-acetyltransferase